MGPQPIAAFQLGVDHQERPNTFSSCSLGVVAFGAAVAQVDSRGRTTRLRSFSTIQLFMMLEALPSKAAVRRSAQTCGPAASPRRHQQSDVFHLRCDLLLLLHSRQQRSLNISWSNIFCTFSLYSRVPPPPHPPQQTEPTVGALPSPRCDVLLAQNCELSCKANDKNRWIVFVFLPR